MKPPPKIDRFLNRYTYVAKLLFIICFSLFCALVLLCIQLYMQIGLVEEAKLQKEYFTKLRAQNEHNEPLSLIISLRQKPGTLGAYNSFGLFSNSPLLVITASLLPRTINALTQLQIVLGEDNEKQFLAQAAILDWNMMQMTAMQNSLIDLDDKEPLEETVAEARLKDLQQLRRKLFNLMKNLKQGFDIKEELKETLAFGKQTVTRFIDTSLQLLDRQLAFLTFWYRAGIATTCFCMAAVFLLYAARVVRKPLDNLREAASELSNGNLSVRVPILSSDEVGHISRKFNNMAHFFELIMIDAESITKELTRSTSEIFDTAKHLEQNVQAQEHAIRLIYSGTKNISLTVQTFALYLKEAHKTALATSHIAKSSQEALLEMETIIQLMTNASNSIVNALYALKEQVSHIHNIINTIIKIADQSNLLSLNAAIRAGKSGAKGIGFIVVADKIRELADMTAALTLRIEQVMQDIVQAVSLATHDVENFSDKIFREVENEKLVNNQLKSVIKYTQQQIDTMHNVNDGMQDQARRAQHIHDSLTTLTGEAEHTTFSIGKLHQEIAFLYHVTNSLRTLIDRFTLRP